jgi:malonate transporter and related proteins
MLDILAVTGPIYLLIALGYAACRWGVFNKADLRALGQFVAQFCLPALVFKALSQRDFGEILNTSYLLAYAGGSLAVMGLGLALARWRGRGLAFSSFYGMGMSCSNSGFIGYPVVLQLLGPPAAVALALCMLVENLLMLPLALTLAESAGVNHLPWYRVLGQSLARVLRNPLVLAIVAGCGMAALGWHLPQVLLKSVDLLAAASSAAALFVIGGALVGRSLQGLRSALAEVALGKLVLHPLLVLGLLLLLPPIDPALRLAAVAFACMPMFSIYPILAQKYGEEGFCAAALLVTTVASFLSITAWLWAVQHLLGWTLA